MEKDAGPAISVVIPLLNEERGIPALLERVFSVLGTLDRSFEVICVDDGSTDGTDRLLREAAAALPGLRVVSLARNFGQHAAVLAGLDAARGAWIVTLDGDLQNPPEEIPRVVAELERGHDVVGTYRLDRKDPLFRRGASWIVNRALGRLVGLEIRDFGCMLRGYSADVARAVSRHPGSKRFLPAAAAAYASNPIEIPASHAPRAAGRSKYSVWKLVRLGADLLASVPGGAARAFLFAGAIAAGGGLILLLASLAAGAFSTAGARAVIMMAGCLGALCLFAGIQLLALALLGTHVRRMVEEAQTRSPYVLREDVDRPGSAESPVPKANSRARADRGPTREKGAGSGHAEEKAPS